MGTSARFSEACPEADLLKVRKGGKPRVGRLGQQRHIADASGQGRRGRGGSFEHGSDLGEANSHHRPQGSRHEVGVLNRSNEGNALCKETQRDVSGFINLPMGLI
jgi:hypothetical protein